ncbi:dihydropteroate synthase [Desulfonatronospira sp.]|uniref:dihydropteroate synthase n=1 Tax=Desulfonatronospira sp. TaxID=1962951 RepID=UPI0025C66125|nr:dihydropteroate synthase [Desulfonatronospira sp.]
MKIIGELINASRKSVGEAIKAADVDTIKKLARDQAENGAHYIDVNAGIFVGKEKDYMEWLIKLVQEEVDVPCCIDSPDPLVVESALRLHQDKAGVPMVNSISLESDRFDNLLPVIAEHQCKVVALCMSEEGMPETAEDRFAIAEKLVNVLIQKGIKADDIYVDPLVQPISTNKMYGVEFLNSIEMIMTRLEGVHTVCGMSNISYGLPKRAILNRSFVVMAVLKGLDTAIINPMDANMMANIIVAETLAGKDEFCMNFLEAYRADKFEL